MQVQSTGLAELQREALLLFSAQYPAQQGTREPGVAPSVWHVRPAPAQQSPSTRHACETLEQVVTVSQIPSLQKSPPPAGS